MAADFPPEGGIGARGSTPASAQKISLRYACALAASGGEGHGPARAGLAFQREGWLEFCGRAASAEKKGGSCFLSHCSLTVRRLVLSLLLSSADKRPRVRSSTP